MLFVTLYPFHSAKLRAEVVEWKVEWKGLRALFDVLPGTKKMSAAADDDDMIQALLLAQWYEGEKEEPFFPLHSCCS